MMTPLGLMLGLLIILLLAAPYLAPLLGFTVGGIKAGSVGAWLMSTFSPTQAGGLVAILQSIGAAGGSRYWRICTRC